MSRDGQDITPEDVSRIWPVSAPVRLRPVAIGTNNRSFIVDCGQRVLFLKAYNNAPDPGRCAFEHRITSTIAARHPSFAVPETILSRSGETHVREHDHFYALSTFIPGTVARAGDPDDAFACGQALAELHAVLSRVPSAPGDKERRDLGELSTVHPLVPEPVRAIREAIDDADLARDVVPILIAVDRDHAEVTAGWPLTWIHWDFYPTNVLIHQRTHHVTGIVDFEFAGAGHRAMDVAIGLYAFAFGQPDIWTLTDRFASGYLSMLELSPEEIEAIPTLILMREATSLVHWTGRSLQGLRDQPGIAQRAQRLVDLARFLDQHGPDLVARLHEIRPGSDDPSSGPGGPIL